MKKILLIASLLLSVPAMAQEVAMPQTHTLKVSGMVCAFCVSALEKGLTSLSEVEAVKVDLSTKVLTITTKYDQPLNKEEAIKKIKASGYTPVGDFESK